MLSDVVHPPEQPPMEQVSSPLSAQILEFCESELFSETIQNTEVTSSSNRCYEEHSSNYATNLPFNPNIIKPPTTTTNDTDAAFSMMFQEEITENDLSAPLDFTTSPHFTLPQYHQDQFDLSSFQNKISLSTNDLNGPISTTYTHQNNNNNNNNNNNVVPITGPVLMSLEDECLSSMLPPSKCTHLNYASSPSCTNSFIDSYLHANSNPSNLSVESSGIFNGNLLLSQVSHELDFQGDNGAIFCPDPLPRYNSNEFQALSNESQHLVNGGGSCSTPLTSEMTSLEAETFRVANKITTEERREKIHRYLKKRNERNFSKKIKYACRKTLADSRPRVRGRFAKNDEFGETNRTTRSNTHEEDTDEDAKSFHVVMKEEENFNSSDIFAQISGLNSFKCNYPIQSWI